MIRNPLVSVVIPAYNAEKFIHKTLQSVQNQSFRDFELIVVDDGSKDETFRVVDQFIKENKLQGSCIRQENKKIAGARNTGILAARGLLIALLDHDDIWYQDKLQRVVDEFNRDPEVGLICHNEIVKKNGTSVKVTKNGTSSLDIYNALLFQGNALSPSASVFKKEEALSIGGFCENPEFNTVEDYDFWMRLSRIVRFKFINETLGEYTLVETAASRQILYHYTNMEIMLKTHLSEHLDGRRGIVGKIMARKRMAVVYRSALGQLSGYMESPEQQSIYARKILTTYPFDIKSLGRLVIWCFNKAIRLR